MEFALYFKAENCVYIPYHETDHLGISFKKKNTKFCPIPNP